MRPSPTTFGRVLGATIAAAALALAAAAPASAAKIEYGIAPQTYPGDSDYRLMSEANVEVIRTLFSWNGIEPQNGDCTGSEGVCNWAGIDALVGNAASNGVRTMATLGGAAPFISNTSRPPTNRADRDAWADFAGAAAERYGPGGVFWNGTYQSSYGAGAPVVPITEWQIWNEQSSNQFFKPRPNAKKYARMLKSASSAITDVHKGAEILTGGMFPDTGPKGIRIEKYLKQLYKVKGIEKSFDAVSVHPYSKKPKGIAGQMKRTRKAMDRAGDKKADIWATELGYSSNGPKKSDVGLKSKKAQAKALKQSFKLLNKGKRRYNVAGIIWFTWQDSNDPNICQFCQSAGLIDTNGDKKPAFREFQKATR